MVDMIESNLAAASVELFTLHEEDMFRQIDEENEKIDGYVEQMEKMNRFLSVVQRDKTDEGLFVKGDDRKLVDELSQYEELQHIFPKGEYDWNKGDFDEMMNRVQKLEERYGWVETQADNLKRQLTQELEGPLQRKITHASEKMLLKENKLNEALSLFKNNLLKMNDLISSILRNAVGQ